MTVGDIIKSVRWCIDEERVNYSYLDGASAYDSGGEHTDIGLMDNIIVHRIGDALRWVSLYAPLELLNGRSSSSSSSSSNSNTSVEVIKEETITNVTNNLIPLDGNYLRLIRVKGANWHRAILGDSLLSEDSGEYLQLRDTHGAQATLDRPQAALINTKEKKIEVWPTVDAGSFTVTYVASPSVEDLSGLTPTSTNDIKIPPLAETCFIYYLAYLVLSAYGDARAKSMFEIATLNIKQVR